MLLLNDPVVFHAGSRLTLRKAIVHANRALDALAFRLKIRQDNPRLRGWIGNWIDPTSSGSRLRPRRFRRSTAAPHHAECQAASAADSNEGGSHNDQLQWAIQY